MFWFKKLLPRILFGIGIALIIASAFATQYGVKTSSSWSIGYNSQSTPAILAAVLPTGSGIAQINITGVSQALYLNLTGNPLTLLGEAGGLGLKTVNTISHDDFQTGVYYLVTGLQGNPITAEQAFQGLVKNAQKIGNSYVVKKSLNPEESIVVLAFPNSSTVLITESFKVTGYGHISLINGLELGLALAIVSVIIEIITRKR
ncbi:MAG: hypothetical protein ACP5L0_06760 [Caldisphaera sp.]|uniref:hypothetical protein n=1 Tax=Caldisphaera sp. TaxID=2060322 RepID=UPI003D09A3E7